MKVLAITGTPDRPETALFGGLARRGVVVRLLSDIQNQSAAAALAAAGVTLEPLRITARVSPSTIAALRRHIADFKPDVIHAFTGRAISNAVLATAFGGPPIVAYRGTMGNVSRIDPTSWITFLNPRVKRISCVSEAVRQDLLKVRPQPQSLITIHKGHELTWYDQPPGDLKQFGIPQGAVVVACTANMRPLKGADFAIRAMHQLAGEQNAHLLLIGEVRDKSLPGLAKSGAAAQRIHFAGYRSDAVALVAACDIFIMPTVRREGFPKAVIEAMARGLPPIVTSVGGMPEQVIDGECGTVVPPGDASALAQAMGELIRDPDRRRIFGAAARARVAREFTTELTVQKTHTLYTEMLEENA